MIVAVGGGGVCLCCRLFCRMCVAVAVRGICHNRWAAIAIGTWRGTRTLATSQQHWTRPAAGREPSCYQRRQSTWTWRLVYEWDHLPGVVVGVSIDVAAVVLSTAIAAVADNAVVSCCGQ